MKRGVLAAIVLATMLVQAQGVDLGRLYAERRFFELRDALAAVVPDPAAPEAAGADLSFFLGAVAARFNRLDEAERLLEGYVAAPVAPSVPAAKGQAGAVEEGAAPLRYAKEAYAELMGVYRQRHQYVRIVETRRRMLGAFKGRLTRQEVAAHQSALRLWQALRDVPPQTVEITGPARLPLVDGLDIPVTFAAGTIALEPNTGSAFSIIIRSEAKRLGFRLIDKDVGLNTGTGGKASATLAVAPPMRLGPNILVQNAVFLVFPDAALYRARQQLQRRGTIGAPVLSALGQVTFTRDGTFSVGQASSPVSPAPAPAGSDVQNAEMRDLTPFFFDETDIVVRAAYDGRPVMLVLDTGAVDSSLSARFYADFNREVRARGRREWHEFGSLGGSRRIEAYSIPNLSLALGSRDLVFPGRRLVLTEPTGDDSRYFHGWLGRDVHQIADRLTIDYGSMNVELR